MIISPKLRKVFNDTPLPKKELFFGGGLSGGLKYKDLGYVSDRMNFHYFHVCFPIDDCTNLLEMVGVTI